MIPSNFRLLFSREAIEGEIKRLADEISNDYGNREVLLIGVLKGSIFFVADLARAITSPAIIDFVRLASYGSETRSSGIVEMRKDLELPIKDKDVIIVEDIIDSGYTLESLYHKLKMREPRSLKICTLVDKKGDREVEIEADYIGMTIDNGYLVGYGLDYDERYRNLPDIYSIEDI